MNAKERLGTYRVGETIDQGNETCVISSVERATVKTNARRFVKRERDRRKIERIKKLANEGDEVCRNILQQKPINKGRLYRGIKTHTSRCWLVGVSLFPVLVSSRSDRFVRSLFLCFCAVQFETAAESNLELILVWHWLRNNFAIEPSASTASDRYQWRKTRTFANIARIYVFERPILPRGIFLQVNLLIYEGNSFHGHRDGFRAFHAISCPSSYHPTNGYCVLIMNSRRRG